MKKFIHMGFGYNKRFIWILRSTPQNQDVYVYGSQIKKFALRKGDIIFGEVREPLNQESNYGLLKLIYINGKS